MQCEYNVNTPDQSQFQLVMTRLHQPVLNVDPVDRCVRATPDRITVAEVPAVICSLVSADVDTFNQGIQAPA